MVTITNISKLILNYLQVCTITIGKQQLKPNSTFLLFVVNYGIKLRFRACIQTQNLIKAETYFIKIGFTQARLQLLPDNYKQLLQVMQNMLSESLESILHYGFDSGLYSENSQPQCWSYTGQNLRFCFQAYNFILVVKNITCLHGDLCFVGGILRQNGRQIGVSPVYHQLFEDIVNKNGRNIKFYFEQDRKQLFLKCSLSFKQNIPSLDKIKICLESIMMSCASLQKALQAVGNISKFNRMGLKMKKNELKLKNSLAQSLKSNSVNDGLDQFSSNPEQNFSVVRVKKVDEVSTQSSQAFSLKKGGYFQVQKKSSIVHTQSGESIEKQLAWKTPLNNGMPSGFLEQKIRKQIQFVSKVLDSKYLLNYYVNESDPSSVYMDYAPGLLKDYIHNRSLSFADLLNLAEQLVSAVAVLHKSKIVHRDLKPDNILIQGKTLKIIDYAESAMVDDQYQPKHYLGCTLPYSPIECILGKEQGYNKKEIDLWSISMILYEMAFKSLPMYYTRWIGVDILEKWRTTPDFSIFPLYRKRAGIKSIESAISLITTKGIQVKPEERLSLNTLKKLLSNLKQFYRQFSDDY